MRPNRLKTLMFWGLLASALGQGIPLPRPAAAAGFLGMGGTSDEPGTKDWWNRHKREAVMVPGKGYQVEGVEGFFDGEGRPINAPVDEVAIGLNGEDLRSGGLIPGLDPKRAYENMKEAVGLGPNQELATQELAAGEALFAKGEYAGAEGHFKTAIARWPGSAVEENARFLLAECYFWRDKYKSARDEYDDLVHEFPSTRRLNTLVEREWAIAQYWEKHYEENPTWTVQPNTLDKTRPTFDTIGQAMKTYESIRLNDPTGPLADDAIMATANSYFRRGRFYDADENYELLRREYPRSEHQFDAHLLGLQSKLRIYQGPDYDGVPLEDAQRLLKQLRIQFGVQLSEDERGRLAKVEAELARAVDLRTLSMAKYYDDLEEYGSARMYYQDLAQERPEAPVGQEAASRLAEIGDEPPSPPTPLPWLVGLFPESRERAAVSKLRAIDQESRAAAEEESRERVANGSGSDTAPTTR